MERNAKILVVGERGIAGNALLDYFKLNGFDNVLGDSVGGLNLTDQGSVSSFFKSEKPKYVFLVGAKSGGIAANMKYPAEFIYDNLEVQNNIIHYSYKFGVKKLLFLGSSCMYPRNCPQPIKEEYLFSGELEKTSEPYAVAKIAGIEMCRAYNQQYGVCCISAVPATIYGPGDDFDLERGHVVSSLIRKFHAAGVNNDSEVVVWGRGKARREFLYVDDLVNACIFLMDNYYEPEIINVGCGGDLTIKELALLIKDIVGFGGKIVFDASIPDGPPRKLLDNSKITKLGWSQRTSLKKGIGLTYNWYKESIK